MLDDTWEPPKKPARLSRPNIWPSVSDVALTMLLILIFYIFMQFILTSKYYIQHIIERNMDDVKASFLKDKELKKYYDDNKIKIFREGNMERFHFSSEMLFDSASARLKNSAKTLLEIFSRILKQKENDISRIIIEGHADIRPLRGQTRYKDNWDLSSARAAEVVLFLSEKGIDKSKLSAVGYSSFQPVQIFFEIRTTLEQDEILERIGDKFDVGYVSRENERNLFYLTLKGGVLLEEPETYLKDNLGSSISLELDIDSQQAMDLNRRIEIVLYYSDKDAFKKMSN